MLIIFFLDQIKFSKNACLLAGSAVASAAETPCCHAAIPQLPGALTSGSPPRVSVNAAQTTAAAERASAGTGGLAVLTVLIKKPISCPSTEYTPLFSMTSMIGVTTLKSTT